MNGRPQTGGLCDLATDRGIFAILAIDHRDSLRVLLDPSDPSAVPAIELTEFKRAVIEGAGGAASGVMLEPEYSIPQLVGDLPPGIGFLAALEAQGYEGDPYARTTTLLDGWSVRHAAAAGASGAKLLLFYTPEVRDAAARQDALVRRVSAECQSHGLPLFLEPLAYPARAESGAGAPGERRRLVVETAQRLTSLGPSVLKLQFPADAVVDDQSGWADACAELDSVVTVPWALLSLGVSYVTFRLQVETACRAGASGFMVGRAAWGELVAAEPATRRSMAAGLVSQRLTELREIACDLGRPIER
ncbi:MAG: tagatose 1,6-diphosphate aldolase [Acidimicrobiia bacterium]|nr:tagatose 1,6-diphosphate aldolase [Acidimicrobiia bacterium]